MSADPGSASWEIPRASSASKRAPCSLSRCSLSRPAPRGSAAADVPLSRSSLLAATPTSTGADYPRHSHRKPAWAAASTTAHGASRYSRHAGSRGPAEILGRDGVEEFPELLDLVFLLVRDGHAHLVQDLFTGEDLRAGAQGQRDRVRWPRAHLGAVGEDQVSVEDPVPQLGDVHRPQLDVQNLEDVLEQIVRQRPDGDHALLRKGDCRSLDRPDPDWQVAIPLRLLEQDDGAVRRHLDPDADDLHLPHCSSVLTCLASPCWPPLPLPSDTRNRPEADLRPPAEGSEESPTWSDMPGPGSYLPTRPGAAASPASPSADSTSVACSRKVRSAICQAVRAAASLAPGSRWRSCGATTCSIRLASRSAAALTARRCRACTPYWRSAATARTTARASGPYCRPTRRIRP